MAKLGEKKSFLIIHRNPVIRGAVAANLRLHGYKIITAATEEEAETINPKGIEIIFGEEEIERGLIEKELLN